MNALTTAPTRTDDQLIPVLQSSLYPGANTDSIRLVLAYCRAANLDPMLKPVHIVPVWNSALRAKVDTIMPGVGLYRIQAARSGDYAGKSEPLFGPTVALELGNKTFHVPEWCSVTVKRIVHGHVCDFTATEFWTENYATKGKDKDGRDSDVPNTMWAKRARGQLAKCAEAQALRMAFPELTGGMPTAEEMEGKTIEHAPEPEKPQRGLTARDVVEMFTQELASFGHADDLKGYEATAAVKHRRRMLREHNREASDIVEALFVETWARLLPPDEPDPADGGEVP